MLILRIRGTDGDAGTTEPWRIFSPVGQGACRMGVSNCKGAEVRGVLEGGVSHTFFLLSYSTEPKA